MKRREFIKNSTLFFGCCSLLSGCLNIQNKNKAQVIRRKLNDNTTLPLIALGGLMGYPLRGENITYADFKKTINIAMESGMNYFDTAYMHKYEETQQMLSKVLKKYPRESYILGNKISVYSVKNKKDVRTFFLEQLKLFNSEYFDNYTIFNIVKKNIENYRKNEIYDELLKLKNEGRIKNLGFSGPSNPVVFREVIKEHKFDFCSTKLNYLDWIQRNQKALWEILIKENIPIIATEALRGGTLTSFNDEINEKIKQINPNETQASFALRWLASKKGVVSILCDNDDIMQVKENIETFSNYKPFNEIEEKTANEITEIICSKNIIKCDLCGKCSETCPKNIEINKIFSLYNAYKLSSSKERGSIFVSEYKSIPEHKRANNCINCSKCLKCHQKIDIPKYLKEVHNTYLSLEKV